MFAVESALTNRLRDEFNSHGRDLIDISGIRRRYFNESAGMAALRVAATAQSFNLLHLDANLYLCVAAANCLIKYNVSGEKRDGQVGGSVLQGRVPRESLLIAGCIAALFCASSFADPIAGVHW